MRVDADLAQRDSPSRRANTGALFELVDSGRGCGAAVRDAEPEFAFPTDRCGWESLVWLERLTRRGTQGLHQLQIAERREMEATIGISAKFYAI